jgi:hypothetical protein
MENKTAKWKKQKGVLGMPPCSLSPVRRLQALFLPRAAVARPHLDAGIVIGLEIQSAGMLRGPGG